MQLLASFFDYTRTFYRYAQNRLFVLLGLIALGGTVEMLGLAMLLPILGVSTGALSDDPFSRGVHAAFERIGATPSLGNLLLLMVAIFVFKGALVLGYSYLMLRLTTNLRREIQAAMAERFGAMNYVHYTSTKTGYLNNIMIREIDRFIASFRAYARIMISALYVVAYVVGSALLRPDLMLVLLAAGGVSIFALRGLVSRTKDYSIRVTTVYADAQTALVEMIHNFIYLKSTGAMRQIVGHVTVHIRRLAGLELRLGLMVTTLESAREPLAVIALALLVFYQVEVKSSSLNEIMVVGLLLYRMFTQILNLQGEWQKFNQSVGGVHAVESATREFEAQREKTGHKKVARLDAEIRFEDVDFGHGLKEVLSHVDLAIKPNQTVGIVGPSGAGKTTFFYLLTGLLDPDGGRITIGGQDYREIDKEGLRAGIGYVTQDPSVFDDTVGYNIAFWRCDPHDPECSARIREAAALANCSELVADLDAQLGEKGVRLSGGERQRIAIARELFKQPQLLIFDEATSALDSHSEAVIQESIGRMQGKRTLVIIAHRLSTVRKCDWIYVFSAGQVVESGTFEELYNRKDSQFRRMCDKQGIAA